MTLMEIAEYCSIPVIVALCYGLVELLKRAFRSCTGLKSFFPLIAGITGTVLGVVGFFADPELMPTDSLLGAALAFFYQTMEIRLRRRQHQYRKARK